MPRRNRKVTEAAFLAVTVIGVCGGLWWYFTHIPERPPGPAPIAAIPPTPPPALVPVAEILPDPVVAPATKPAAPAPPPVPVTPQPASPAPAPAAVVDAYKDPLVLDAVAARSPVVMERAARLLRSAFQDNEWPRYLDLLRRSLAAELKKNRDFESVQRYDRYASNPFFMRAMLQHAMLALAGDDARKLATESELVRQHLIWLCESHETMESFLAAVTPRDNFRRVIETWAGLAADDAEALGTYRELAIACSLVLEKPRTFDWNGHKTTITAAERYRWYKAKDKAGLLETKLTKLSAWHLAWVVGVPVPESEMDWTLAELRRKLKQGDWGRAYEMVPYDMQKAVTGKMKEPYDYYTFAEILKKGGICGDRAYFAANTARCAGIPAVSLSGDGARGPHAWIAWLADDDKWAFSGRFDGYAAGTVGDPRNGEKMSEQIFTRLSDRHAPGAMARQKAQRLVWMHELHAALGDTENAANALAFAMRASPHQAELWEKKIEAMKKQVPPPDSAAWKTFLDALRREFRDDTDMLAQARDAEDKYVLALANTETVKNELRGDIRDLGKLKGLTSREEILTAHRRYADVFAKTNDFAGIRHIYRDALDDYGREAAKFKALARDYWGYTKTAAETVRLAACRDIEAAYQRHVETRGGDYFDVQSQNSAAQVVADCWREAGQVAKADRIEKDIEKRGGRAKKDAL